MKVLFNTSNFPKYKGDKTTPFIFSLARAIHKQGVEVIVLAPHSQGAKVVEYWEGVQIRRYRYFWPYKFEVLFSQGGALASMRNNKLIYLLIPFFVTAQFFYSAWVIFKEKPDLIHSHWLIPQGWVGLLDKYIFQIPQLVSVHGADLFTLNFLFLKRIKSLVVNRSDLTTVNSPMTQNELTGRLKRDGFEKKVKLIPMGVDPRFFEAQSKDLLDQTRKKIGLLKGEFVVLFVGRMVVEKGILDLVEAFSIFRKQVKHAKLVMVGDGPDFDQAQKLVDQKKLSRQTVLTGWIPMEKLPIYYQMSDLFVGLSKQSTEGWKEALGLTFLEACASGCAVITTKTSGFSVYADKYQSAICVESGDVEEASKMMIDLYNNSILRQTLCQNALRMVKKEFSYDYIAQKFVNVYKELTA